MFLVRRRPNNSVHLFDTLDRFFDDSFFDLSPEKTWSPSVDIEETGKELLFRIEVPGFEKDDLNISADNNVLTISGERKLEKEEKGKHVRIERYYGTLRRSFYLPEGVDTDKIDARLKNGVLTVTVPRREAAKPKQIPVTVN